MKQNFISAPTVACHLLGDYLESIKKDFEKASKVYRSNCDDYGYARSCLKYGNYSFLGKGKSGSSGSVLEAYKYYEKGCTLNEPDSCLHSGLILVSRSMKEEVNRDVKKVCTTSYRTMFNGLVLMKSEWHINYRAYNF